MDTQITINGHTFNIRRLSPMRFQLIKEQRRRIKPNIPLREVNVAGKLYAQEDYNNEGYQKALDDWEDHILFEQLRTSVIDGLIDEPPDEYVIPSHLGVENTWENRKYLWVCDLLGDMDNIMEFINSVFGLSQPTEEEVQGE